MTSLHRSSDLATALLDVLDAAGVRADVGGKPAGAGWQGDDGDSAFHAYVSLYPSGGSVDGDLDDPNEDSEAVWQVSGFAASALGALYAGDRAQAALLAATIVMPDRVVHVVSLDMQRILTRDDDAQPPIWQSIDRYRIADSPADG